MPPKAKSPLPYFDSYEFIKQQVPPVNLSAAERQDFAITLRFLCSYVGSIGTFDSYRREVERLLQWSFNIVHKTLPELKRDDLEAFIRFCQKPPKAWIGTKKAPRFINRDGIRQANPNWTPFVATLPKGVKNRTPDPAHYELSHEAVKEIFAILGSFFNYLLQEEYTACNPVAIIRQKSKFIRKVQGGTKIRRLSELQWHYVITTARRLAEENPAVHERTYFMMSAFYLMYLRISELVASKRWTPLMCHFQRDSDNHWWFTTVGKGNKERQIAVSDSMLAALKRWRIFLGLSALPSPADRTPLIPRLDRHGPLINSSQIRRIVQFCFDQAGEALKQDNYPLEAELLTKATVHWLRHTGISDDVKRRPREHVRDDAGHSSSVTTDRYIDVELKKRHQSAKNKPLE